MASLGFGACSISCYYGNGFGSQLRYPMLKQSIDVSKMQSSIGDQRSKPRAHRQKKDFHSNTINNNMTNSKFLWDIIKNKLQ